jgi:hypothetical protein
VTARRLPLLPLALAALMLQCAASADPASNRTADISGEVRRFAAEVAAGVSHDGPLAWQRYFAPGPEFFMGVNGQLQFADGAAARRGIAGLPRLIRTISLTFGDDLRVDPLTADLAVLACSYREVIVSPQGVSTNDHGLFTAVVERSQGAWRFRDVHWSSQPRGP